MGSKKEYEADKAARKKARDEIIQRDAADKEEAQELVKGGFDIADRIATALERIADAMEAKNG